MRVHLKRRKTLRNAGLATVLAAAALLLSGCLVVYDNGDGTRNITVPPAISDQIIWDCTVKHGTGAPRAFCALDTIHAICSGIKIKGISESDCNHISSYGDWQDMEQAIVDVTRNYDCLSFDWLDGTYPDDYWYAIPKGYRGCK
jgi:hypothetical protein